MTSVAGSPVNSPGFNLTLYVYLVLYFCGSKYLWFVLLCFISFDQEGGEAEAENGVVVVFGKACVDRFDKSEEAEEVVVVEFDD